MASVFEWIRKHAEAVLLLCLIIFFSLLSYKSEGAYGGADNYGHYQFARYAFKYPHLFLDLWGKPAFTFLTSPFAQFGFMGMKFFNLIAGLLAAFVTYKVCKHFSYRFSWLAIIMVCFAPAYLSMMLSGMTEILFSLVLISSVYLALRKNFIWSAVILSALPFVRNEGFVVFPFFITYYILQKQYKAIPFILTCFIVVSIAGAGYYRDVLWVFTRTPYTGAKDIYGSGSLFHFVNATKDIFGIPLAILGVIGIVFLIVELIKKKYNMSWFRSSHPVEELLLVMGPLAAYYVAHSFLWWKGLGGSLGLIRVIAGVVPLFAVIGIKGINRMAAVLQLKWVAFIIVVVFTYLLLVTPFKVLQLPVRLEPAERLVKDAGIWIHQQGLDKHRVYYYDPLYWFFLDIDPNDQNNTWQFVPNREVPSQAMPDSSVVFWDAHFGPNEGGLKLEKLMNDTFLSLLKVFRPLQPFTTLGGYNYELCVFRKTLSPNNISLKWENYHKADSINEISMKRFLFYDFETSDPLYQSFERTNSFAYSGKFSCLMTPKEEFGPTIILPFTKLQYPHVYRASIRVFSKSNINWKSVLLVVSADHKDKTYLYSTGITKDQSNNWKQIKLSFELPAPKSDNDVLKIYIWNKDKQRFYIDDLEVND